MTTPSNCTQNTDPLKLIRDGLSQDQRLLPMLDPAYAPIDARQPEHAMMFAKAYSKYLQFYGSNNTVTGNWEPFFSQDVSAQLAVAAIQDVDYYKSNVKASFDFLKNNENKSNDTELKKHLGYLFSYVGTLAKQIDILKAGLPNDIALKDTLQNLIQKQLAPAFTRLIAYYKADSDQLIAVTQPDIVILGETTTVFSNLKNYNFSHDWIADNSFANWAAYTNAINADNSVFGTSKSVFESINHIAAHNLFSDIFDQFLKVFARIVSDAKTALEATFTNWDKHEPHYALFLSFIKLLEHARAETNTLTQRHLDFYYREILKLKEKPAEPSHAHVLVTLAKHVNSHELKAGELFKAGKDALGIEAFFASNQDFIANQAQVTELKTLYRHNNKPNDTLNFDQDRLFASPVSQSADGLGAKLTTPDRSWHPFFNKSYVDGNLAQINMPPAEVGFAIASHYLLLAEGERTLTIDFNVQRMVQAFSAARKINLDHASDIICLLTTEKGWFEKAATSFTVGSGELRLQITLTGADPAVIPYALKIHGDAFNTNLPILLVKLRHKNDQQYLYQSLQDKVIETINLTVAVKGLKSLAVSNDFGSIDTSKPFQPFGASPIASSGLVIGSKEVFQKALTSVTVNMKWQSPPSPYNKSVMINTKYLHAGAWQASGIAPSNISSNAFSLNLAVNTAVIDLPDFSETELYSTGSRYGFVRFEISTDFGQQNYQQALIDSIITQTAKTVGNPGQPVIKPIPPLGPFVSELTLDYTTAKQTISLNHGDKAAFAKRQAHYFHLAPFGFCEQHRLLNTNQKISLFPQFNFQRDKAQKDSNAEFYIGVTGLKPPQNLALLFQVAEGTADPLAIKPDQHIHWSYLSANEWVAFAKNAVQDSTDGLLNSGIITFSMPDTASANNTLLPTGQYWLRAAVTDETNAVCRLLDVLTQGLTVTFNNQGNDPAFAANALQAGSISKLDQPDAAVKQISQPFAAFGGRAAEQSSTFYTRISERLRHKGRAITLWDYEHLILEAFPQIYKVKCLNHTFYDNENGVNFYKELAPGHVTIVTIPNQQFQNLRDPLRPYTSLGLLEEIKAFLQQRLSCFVKLHVKNPLFEEVGTQFKVRFFDGFDETFYVNKLDEAITRFLSPWAFQTDGNPTFGGKIYQSVLINFIEEQPYVDYVTDFKLSHTYSKLADNGSEITIIDSDVTEIQGSKAVSLLVSAKHHRIEIINPASQAMANETCPCAV